MIEPKPVGAPPEAPVVPGAVACPVPVGRYDHIVLGHGSGGRLSADLLQQVFLPALGNDVLRKLEDQAIVPFGGARLAFTTDAFVVRPPFFPGGDIGKLAVCGTINDLAVGGAKPLYLSAAFILEEGLPMADLTRIVASFRDTCNAAGVAVIAGDTKVVDRGKGDQIFIATSGIGLVPVGVSLSITAARPGDKIVLSGTIGDHGMAVMSVRENLEFETELKSDCAALHALTAQMLDACPQIRCMRDPTRGGLAAVLNEIASAARVGVHVDERRIPVRPEVSAACEMLGFDPVYVANEGKLVAVVPPEFAEPLVATMRGNPHGIDAAIIGEVVPAHPGIVRMKSLAGGERVVTMLAGEQLPRIC